MRTVLNGAVFVLVWFVMLNIMGAVAAVAWFFLKGSFALTTDMLMKVFT